MNPPEPQRRSPTRNINPGGLIAGAWTRLVASIGAARVGLLTIALTLMAGGCANAGLGYQAPMPITRLWVHGAYLDDAQGHHVLLRGYNIASAADVDPYIDTDAADIRAQGLNFMRVTPQWYGDPAGACSAAAATPPSAGEYPATADAYNPPASDGTGGTGTQANGWFTASQLARLDQQVYSYTSRQIWVDIGITANTCDFYTNSTIQTRFDQMWAFLAARYKNTPYVAMYELMTEPNPPGDQFNNVTTLAMYDGAAAAIRAVDAVTPIEIGCAKNYNARCLQQVNMYWRGNIVYAVNWYEEDGYVAQLKSGGGPYTGYPGAAYAYYDSKGGQPSISCTYPNINAGIPSMTQAWLAAMWDACPGSMVARLNVPVLVEQIGVRTATPGAFQYTSDQLDTFNARRNAGVVGWAWWVYRNSVTGGTATTDGTNGGDSGDLCMLCRGPSGTWIRKDGSYSCAPVPGSDGSSATCSDWLDMIVTKGTN